MQTAAMGSFIPASPMHQQTLERKNYLLAGQLTAEGHLLWLRLKQEADKDPDIIDLPVLTHTDLKEALKGVKKAKKEQFEQWWNTFPATTTWTDGTGNKWHGGRGLRKDKVKCEKLYYDCIGSGADSEKMLAALLYEIEEKKKKSIATGKNHMDYFQGSSTYLNQRTYEGWIATMEQEKTMSFTKSRKPIDTQELF